MELVARKNGAFTPANEYFNFNSSFGTDGCSEICEIRPGFSTSPIDLTAKIRTVLEYGAHKEPELEFYAGQFVNGYPIGGHCHVGLDYQPELIEAYDVVLGALSKCIDDLEQREKRQKSGYGKKGAYERNGHGFEYRFPGSFLLSPSITLVTFTLLKLATIGVIDDELNFAELKGRQKSRTFLRNFETYLKTIPDDCIEGLRQLTVLLDKTINWDENILPNWGIAA